MDSAFVTFLSNLGTAGVVVILLMTGWLVPKWAYEKLERENKSLREALDLERQRATEAATAHAQVANQLLGSLVEASREPRRRDKLSWEDLT